MAKPSLNSNIRGTHTLSIQKSRVLLNSGNRSKKERAYIVLKSSIPNVGKIRVSLVFVSNERDIKDWEQDRNRVTVYLHSDVLAQSIELLKLGSGTSFTISNSTKKYFRLNYSSHD